MRHDTLADVFSILKNAERVGKKECLVPASRLAERVLEVVKNNGYISEYKKVKTESKEKIHVQLLGKINDCNVIKPRFPVKTNEFIKWEKRYLPASGFGTIIITTSKGLMSHEEAKSKSLGGSLVAFVY